MIQVTPPDMGPPAGWTEPPLHPGHTTPSTSTQLTFASTLTKTYFATDRDGLAPTDRRQGRSPRHSSHTRDSLSAPFKTNQARARYLGCSPLVLREYGRPRVCTCGGGGGGVGGGGSGAGGGGSGAGGGGSGAGGGENNIY